jgi:hypothetical protein
MVGAVRFEPSSAFSGVVEKVRNRPVNIRLRYGSRFLGKTVFPHLEAISLLGFVRIVFSLERDGTSFGPAEAEA